MTFSIFSFCGVFTVFALIMYMGKAEIVAKLATKKSKQKILVMTTKQQSVVQQSLHMAGSCSVCLHYRGSFVLSG